MTAIGNPLWVQALTYAAADDRTILRFLINTQGVGSPTSLAVTQNGTPNMSVNVAAGQAAIFRTSSSPSDFYVVESPNASTNLTIAASDPTNPRIDLIIARVNDAQYSGGTNNATVEVVTGTPAASPVAPTQPSTSLLLATVAVAANATTIVNANITDNRVNWTTQRPANSTISFATSGSLTASQCAGAKTIRVRCWGPGGGGGSAAGVTNQTACAAGGGGGGYAESLISVSSVSFPVTVTVGTGGTAGTAGGAGGAGSSSTSFGSLVIATAGNGGQAGLAASSVAVQSIGGLPGSGSAGAIQITGQQGGNGVQLSATAGSTVTGWGGSGGGGAQGGGTNPVTLGANTAGGAGFSPGGGGAGARNSSAGTVGAANGGAGANGFCIVELIY